MLKHTYPYNVTLNKHRSRDFYGSKIQSIVRRVRKRLHFDSLRHVGGDITSLCSSIDTCMPYKLIHHRYIEVIYCSLIHISVTIHKYTISHRNMKRQLTKTKQTNICHKYTQHENNNLTVIQKLQEIISEHLRQQFNIKYTETISATKINNGSVRAVSV